MRFFFISAFILLSFGLITAQNLVPNPGFDLTSACPGGIPAINTWTLLGGHGGSPDGHCACSNGSSFGAPGNVFGNQAPRSGACYIGFVTRFVSANFREYVQIQLTSPLTAGMSYEVEAYISLSDGSGYGTGGYQFYFTNTAVTGPGGNNAITIWTPQAQNPITNHITDKINWVRVADTFTAVGGEQYLTLGNFFNDATTSFSVVTGWTWNYSYMDDVSVREATVLSGDLTGFSGDWIKGDYVELDWQLLNEKGSSHFEVLKAVGTTANYEVIGKVNVDSDQQSKHQYDFRDTRADRFAPNFYRLRMVDEDGKITFSGTVEVAPFQIGDYLLQVYPNPQATGYEIHLEANLSEEKSMKVSWLDVMGKEVRAIEIAGNEGHNHFVLPTEGLAAGVYFLKYQAGNLSGTRKVVLQ